MSDTLACGAKRKFIVYKIADTVKYLNNDERKQLVNISSKLSRSRKRNDKKPVNEYLVINIDEPYINEIIEIMKRNGHWG